MRRQILSSAILLAALFTSGCFVSKEPIFPSRGLAFPVPNGAHFVQYSHDDKEGWKKQGSGTVLIKDGHYIATNDKEKDRLILLMRPWGKNYLAAARDADKKDEGYLYGILVPDGDDAYLEYGPTCDQVGADKLKKMGLVTFMNDDKSSCVPVNERALGKIMQMVLDSGAKPDSRYVIVK